MARAATTVSHDGSEHRSAVPPHPLGQRPLRIFTFGIALPALLLYLVGAGIVFFGLGAMARDVDRYENAHGIAQMHGALDAFLGDLASAVADEGTWDEAYLNVVVNADPAWMDTTWGKTARLGLSYDAVLVTDNDGNIIFGEDAVGPIKGTIAARYPAASAMLTELDKAIASAGDASTVTHFATDDKGAAALAAVSIHQALHPSSLAVPRQARRILWIVRHFSSAILQDMASRYQTPLATLVATPDPDQSAIDIADATGDVAGTIAWSPDRPGSAAFTRTALLAAGILLAVGVALVIGLGILRRAMLRHAKLLAAALAAPAAAAATPAPASHRGGVAISADDEAIDPSPIEGVVAADFELEYEPVFDLRAQTMVGAEMRLRWRKPDKSPLLQENLSTDQNVALLDRVGILALRRATDEMAPLLGMALAVTVTSTQLLMGVFAEKLSATLSATGFPGKRLLLCVDAGRLPPPEELATAVARIRKLGVAVQLSGFALGPATTPYVHPGIADGVRLTRAMVAGIDSDPARLALLETTLALARDAGWSVTVPFVGRKEEVGKLLRLGCRDFEGPLFAQPMPIAALTSLILSQPTRQAS